MNRFFRFLKLWMGRGVTFASICVVITLSMMGVVYYLGTVKLIITFSIALVFIAAIADEAWSAWKASKKDAP